MRIDKPSIRKAKIIKKSYKAKFYLINFENVI